EESRAMQFVENRVDERHDEPTQLHLRSIVASRDLVEEREDPVEGVLMAGEEDLFLVAKVVVQIAFVHPERGGNLFDGGAVVPELSERRGRALQDLDARRLRAGGGWRGVSSGLR